MEVEIAKAIHSSMHWDEICKELNKMIDSQLQQTRICSPDQLGRIQAKIQAYEEVKNIPQTVIDREE